MIGMVNRERGKVKKPPEELTQTSDAVEPAVLHYVDGDPEFLQKKGLKLQKSLAVPNSTNEQQAMAKDLSRLQASPPYIPAALPPGSSAPYLTGQMTPNPSLWPDEAQGASMFRDMRASQAMDVITIVIDETTRGRKKAETDSEGKYSLSAAIENFFGIETKSWAANNTSLDPTALVNATTNNKFEGEGETKREGELKAKISAVIMEVLPNSLLRVEGTKIVSVNDEEEVMVLSGLVRQRDIDALNQIQSSRIANMRIDFYGRGVIAENQQPGWLGRIFNRVWPF